MKNPNLIDAARYLAEMEAATAQFRNFLAEQEQLTRKISAKMQATIQALASIQLPQLTVPKIDAAGLNNQMIRGQAKLAETGWTIVGWIALPHARAFGGWSESKIEKYFETQYLCPPENQLKRLRTRLLRKSSFSPWKDLLRESFRAFDQGLHRICVPSLLSVLEGYAFSQLVERAESYKRISLQRDKKMSRRLRDESLHEGQSVKAVIWRSLLDFFDKLYTSSDFSSARPIFLNRHWILHGRSESNWTRMEALRLFNALDTLQWACEDLKNCPIESSKQIK